MIDWGAISGIGGLGGCLGTVLGVVIGHWNMRSKDYRMQVAGEAILQSEVKKIQPMEDTLNKHLLECAAANAKAEAAISRLEAAVAQLTLEIRRPNT